MRRLHRIIWAAECVAIVGSFVWSLFAPERGGRAYVVFVGAPLASFFIYQFLLRTNELSRAAQDLEFSADEKALLRKYRFWFKDPATAVTMCSIASLLQLSAMICVPWFAYQSQWFAAIVGTLAFAFAPFFRQRFDPFSYLNMLASKRPTMGFSEELGMVEQIAVKLTGNALSKGKPSTEAAPKSERHAAAFNVLLAKHAYGLLDEVDQNKVKERAADILKRVMPRPPTDFNSEVEKYGWYALAMRELGIPPALVQYSTWHVTRNPFMDVLPGDPAIDGVSRHIRDKFGVDVSVSTEHRILDRFMNPARE